MSSPGKEVCGETKQSIFFKKHLDPKTTAKNPTGAPIYCDNFAEFPEDCNEHTHCGDENANPDCSLCPRINSSQTCKVCGERAEIFSIYIEDVEAADTDVNGDIVLRPEFFKTPIGQRNPRQKWEEKLLHRIMSLDNQSENGITLRVYSAMCEEMIDEFLEKFPRLRNFVRVDLYRQNE